MSNPNCYCRGELKGCLYCNPKFDFGPVKPDSAFFEYWKSIPKVNIQMPYNGVQQLLERLHAVENQPDFLALWKGRPKKKTIWLARYFFRLNKGGTLRALHLEPSRFIPIDWRGLL